MNYSPDPTATPLRELKSAAEKTPNKELAALAGEVLTYSKLWESVQNTAKGLRSIGIAEGDRILIMTPNIPEAIFAWFGAQLAGAVESPVTMEATGAYLDYLVKDLEIAAIIGTPESMAALSAATDYPVPLRIVVGDFDGIAGIAETTTISFADVISRGKEIAEELTPPDAWKLGTIMYTSGTTGPSKGVMLSQGYFATLAWIHKQATGLLPGSRIYCVQPLCHLDGRSALVDAIHLEGSVKLGQRFSASRFWEEMEEYDADSFIYVGTMLHLLNKQPKREMAPRALPRIGYGSATPATLHLELNQRFNVNLIEGYGMTEFGLIANQIPSDPEPGSVGPEVDWVEIRLVDEFDREVPDGQPGELIARSKFQHTHMMGYWRKPEATIEAWRGLWHHTGDLLRRLPSGSLEYIGRNKDSIRRRGENVSAWELEETAARHPGVLEAAAIGIPSEVGDEDIALLVVASPIADLDLAQLRDQLSKDLPSFALPRFIEVVPELPKTPSERIAKALVRERGISEAAVDFETRR